MPWVSKRASCTPYQQSPTSLRCPLLRPLQARALRPQLMELMQQHGDPLFIVSPLSRAIETFLLMLPDPERLKVYPQTPPPPGSRSSSSQPTQTHVQRTSRLLPGTSEGEGTAGSSCVNGASAVVASLASRPVNMVICPYVSCAVFRAAGS